jgi:hypothetical protein
MNQSLRSKSVFRGGLVLARIVTAFVICCGCGAKTAPLPRDVDLSKPKAAALSFLRSLARGDGRTARAISIGSEADTRWVDAMVTLITGLREYDQALLDKFNREALPMDVTLKQAIATFADEPVMRLQGGVVKEAEDTAEVDPGLGGVRLSRRRPVYLRKQGDVWKVDLAAMRDDPQHDPALAGDYILAGKAMRQAASDIRRGHYKTFQAAQDAVANYLPG